MTCGCEISFECGACCDFGFCIDPSTHADLGFWEPMFDRICPKLGCEGRRKFRDFDLLTQTAAEDPALVGRRADEYRKLREIASALHQGRAAETQRWVERTRMEQTG